MKPDTRTAMQHLLDEIRIALPLEADQAQLCEGTCIGCPKKLTEYMDSEVEQWQATLDQGGKPSLADLNALGKTAKKIHTSLWRNEKLRPYMKPQS